MRNVAEKRAYFYLASAWAWVQENHSEVAKAIREEGYRRFPAQRPYKNHNLKFLDKLKTKEKT